MKPILCLLAGLFIIAGSLSAQCLAPGTENFDSATATTTASCGLTSPGVLPMGWTLDASSTNAWRVRTGSTPSSGTGPSGDHTSGMGNYLYTETSGGCTSMVALLESPCFDASAVVSPAVEFWYHMWGDDMGSLQLEAFDGSNWTTLWIANGDQGNQWNFISVPVAPYTGTGGLEFQFRFRGTAGAGFESDMAIDDVTFGEASVVRFQNNSAELSLDIDGVETDVYFNPALVQKQQVTCPGQPNPPIQATLNVSSTNVGELYDVVISPAPVVCCLTGGVVLPDGQIVNLDLLVPFIWLSSGSAIPVETYMPGIGFPGATNTSFSVPFEVASNEAFSMQGIIMDPAATFGFTLSQATRFEATYVAGPTMVAGPTTDDGTVTIDVTSPPYCWAPAGIPFYGTTFTQLSVAANGRVTFGGADGDFSPTVGEALTDNAFVGYWTDFNPAIGGTIAVSNPAMDLIRVQWTNVPYFGEPGSSNTFGIEFNVSTGDVKIDSLLNVQPNPLSSVTTSDPQFIGISPGNLLGATNPGVTPFAAAMVGGATAATDTLYDFNDPASSASGLPSVLVPGTLDQILFTPDLSLVPNYTWIGS